MNSPTALETPLRGSGKASKNGFGWGLIAVRAGELSRSVEKPGGIAGCRFGCGRGWLQWLRRVRFDESIDCALFAVWRKVRVSHRCLATILGQAVEIKMAGDLVRVGTCA